MRCRILELSEYSGRARANKDFCRSQSLNNAETAVQAIGYSGNVDEKRETLAHPTAGEKAVFRFQGAHHCASGGRRRVGIWGLGFKGGCCAGAGSEVGAMFTTAVLWARRSSGLRPGKLNNLGEHVESASQTLYKILENHGPITVTDCWNHAAQMEGNALKSKQHMKMMLRWMRERKTVQIICQHARDKKKSTPAERKFLFFLTPPKVVDLGQTVSGQHDSTAPLA